MQRAPLGKAQALGSLCARPQAAAVWRVPVLWATLLGVSVLWCVGALAPWFAQGAGQLRRQGGSTCHLARPVVAAPAVAVLTRPPVPCHTNPRNNRPRCAWFFSLPFVAVVSSPRLLPLPSPFFSPSPAAVVSSARFLPLPPSSPLPAAPCSPPPFAAAACLLPPLQAPSGTGAGTAGGAARGPVDGGAPVGAYRHLRLDPALLLAPVAAPRAALAPVGGARCVHCQPG